MIIARYLIEDNDGNYIAFDPSKENLNLIIWSIFQKFIGYYKISTAKDDEKNFYNMCWVIKFF